MNLVTLATVKAFLEKTDVTHDDLLTSLIVQYSKRIETYCNRLFEKVSRTQKFNAGRRDYFLPAYPIDTISVTVDGTVQTVDSDYFVYTDEGWVEFYSAPGYTEPQQVSITWVGGYAVADIPQDLQYAAMKQVAYVFRRRKDIGISSVSLPDGSMSISTPDDLLPEVKQILKSFKKAPGPR
jgi:hypothetical protein